MTKNNIREKLSEAGVTQVELAKWLPEEVGKVGVSFIVTGKVLPTKPCMEIICDKLDCFPTDLWEREDLDLLSIGNDLDEDAAKFESATSSKNGSRHGDMMQLRVWLRPYEKEAIESAISDLGYRSIAEWLREMIRNTVARNKRLQAKVPGRAV